MKTVPLGDLITSAVTGFACGTSTDDGVRQLRMNNVNPDGSLNWERIRRVPRDAVDDLTKYLLGPSDIVLNTTNSPEMVGKSAIVRPPMDEMTFSNHFLRIRVKSSVDPAYVQRWLVHQYASGQFRAMCNQWVNQATVPRDRVLNMAVPLPPIEEQRRFAGILDRAEILSALRGRSLGSVDLLLSRAFTQRFPPSLTPRLRLGQVVADLQGGKSLVGDDPDAATRNRVLKISAVTSGHFRPDESKPVPDEHDPPSAHYVQQGDLLISRANTVDLVGAAAYVWNTPSNLLLPDKIWRFQWLKPDSVDPLFALAMLRDDKVRHEISIRASGTGGSMKNISKAKLLDMEVPWPRFDQQKRFGDAVRATHDLYLKMQAALTEQQRLFAALQQRAFRGEL